MDITVSSADGEWRLCFGQLDSLDYWAQLSPPFVRSITLRLTEQERDHTVSLLTHSDPRRCVMCDTQYDGSTLCPNCYPEEDQ